MAGSTELRRTRANARKYLWVKIRFLHSFATLSREKTNLSPYRWRRHLLSHTSCVECCFAFLNRGLTVLANGLSSIVIDMHEHPPTEVHSWDFQLVLILVALTFPSSCYFFNLEPSKLEGRWNAHPRCTKAVSQLVVERQYSRSVSCNVIPWLRWLFSDRWC